jgi:hypothetical protein
MDYFILTGSQARVLYRCLSFFLGLFVGILGAILCTAVA